MLDKVNQATLSGVDLPSFFCYDKAALRKPFYKNGGKAAICWL